MSNPQTYMTRPVEPVTVEAMRWDGTDESAEAAQRANQLLGVPLAFRHSIKARALTLLGVSAAGLLPLASARVRKALSVGAVLPAALAVFAALFVVARMVVPGEANYFATGVALVLSEVLVTASLAQVRREANDDAPLVFEAQKGVALEFVEPAVAGWARVRHRDGMSGYVRASQVWGL